MAALGTVGDYLTFARRLLQDTVTPYRYPDADLIAHLNNGAMEARRLRADLFIGRFDAVPDYTSTAETVTLDVQYRLALAFFVAGHACLVDAEESSDQRAAAFLNQFTSKLLSIAA